MDKLEPLCREKMNEIFKPGEILPRPKNQADMYDFLQEIFDRIFQKFGEPAPKKKPERVQISSGGAEREAE